MVMISNVTRKLATVPDGSILIIYVVTLAFFVTQRKLYGWVPNCLISREICLRPII
jgi:hypothetical protein